MKPRPMIQTKLSPQRQQQKAGRLQRLAKPQILVDVSLHVLLISFRDMKMTACSFTLVISDMLQQSYQVQECDLGKSSNATATAQ